ncbi:hypothetical protein KM043_005837 [Ampulex compressa]|nr:hypothetical protein KM043_005837 [Ampulex compressa]
MARKTEFHDLLVAIGGDQCKTASCPRRIERLLIADFRAAREPSIPELEEGKALQCQESLEYTPENGFVRLRLSRFVDCRPWVKRVASEDRGRYLARYLSRARIASDGSVIIDRRSWVVISVTDAIAIPRLAIESAGGKFLRL